MLAAALGDELIKQPLGNCQGLSSRIGLSVIAFAFSCSKMICKIIEFRYHARPKNWRRISCSLYHLFSFLNAASSVALLNECPFFSRFLNKTATKLNSWLLTDIRSRFAGNKALTIREASITPLHQTNPLGGSVCVSVQYLY
jgi:hypothetical protein